METGDIIFFESDGSISSNIIKIISNFKYVHVGIIYIINGEIYILESQYLEDRRMVHISAYDTRKFIILKPLIAFDGDILKTLGNIRYGYVDLLLNGLKLLLVRFGIKFKFRNYVGEICSEFVSKCNGIEPCNISPKELYYELLKRGSEIKTV